MSSTVTSFVISHQLLSWVYDVGQQWTGKIQKKKKTIDFVLIMVSKSCSVCMGTVMVWAFQHYSIATVHSIFDEYYNLM